jgi:hypothetical protein
VLLGHANDRRTHDAEAKHHLKLLPTHFPQDVIKLGQIKPGQFSLVVTAIKLLLPNIDAALMLEKHAPAFGSPCCGLFPMPVTQNPDFFTQEKQSRASTAILALFASTSAQLLLCTATGPSQGEPTRWQGPLTLLLHHWSTAVDAALPFWPTQLRHVGKYRAFFLSKHALTLNMLSTPGAAGQVML